jgi:hypothetical protein
MTVGTYFYCFTVYCYTFTFIPLTYDEIQSEVILFFNSCQLGQAPLDTDGVVIGQALLVEGKSMTEWRHIDPA